MRGKMRELFCEATTLSPEDAIGGRVVVVNLPVKEWSERSAGWLLGALEVLPAEGGPRGAPATGTAGEGRSSYGPTSASTSRAAMTPFPRSDRPLLARGERLPRTKNYPSLCSATGGGRRRKGDDGLPPRQHGHEDLPCEQRPGDQSARLGPRRQAAPVAAQLRLRLEPERRQPGRASAPPRAAGAARAWTSRSSPWSSRCSARAAPRTPTPRTRSSSRAGASGAGYDAHGRRSRSASEPGRSPRSGARPRARAEPS